MNWQQIRQTIASTRFSTAQSITLIVALSVAFKLGYVITLGGGLNALPDEGSDVWFYNKAAVNLVESGVYGILPGIPTVGMPPGEPVFLALIYIIGNHSIAFAKLAHVALLTGVAILAFLTGKELENASVGFWAGLLIAIDPAQAYLAGTFLSEPLYIFFVMLAIYLLVRPKPRISWIIFIVVGICLGLAGLTRNQGWLFSVALGLGAIVTLGRLLPIREAGILVLFTVLTVAPWTYRNYQVTGQFIPVSTEGGLTLWASNNPLFEFRPPMPMSLPIYGAPSGLSGTQADGYYRQLAIDWISTHPAEFVANGLRKVFTLYNFDPQSWRPEVAGVYRLAGFVPYGALLPFILIGLVNHIKDEKFGIVLYYIAFTTLVAFVFYGDSRIRAPIQPYLYIFGILGVQRAAAWLILRTRREMPQVNE